VPFGSNSVQHGTAVFEGIRCRRTAAGPALFRLDDHLRRLLTSAATMGLPHGYDLVRLRAEVLDATARAGLPDCYVRPVLFTPEPALGVGMAAFRFRLGVEIWPARDATAAAESEVDGAAVRLTVSPWRRPGRSVFPAGTKATGLYALSALAKTAAAARGFDDAIQLDPDSGRVAEATIANVFRVRDGTLHTPWLNDNPLPGITRDTVLALAARASVPVAEGPVDVDALLDSDEVFLTGTAMGLVPVAAIDERTLPPRRPVFHTLRRVYGDAVHGRLSTPDGWLTPVPASALSGSRSRGES
jgi:branched-chain amino acid aminotransferase